MTDTTANLSLPEITASQAQKHVTHNEALRALDVLIQLAVLDRDLASPPGSPAEGQRWLVAASATGAWSGHSHQIAAWQDGAWDFYSPQIGWLAYVIDEGALIAWDGSGWVPALDMVGGATELQNMALLGLGTTADSTNPLSAKLNNALWTAKTEAEGGDGNLRYKLSKESSAKTLSLLFQDNYSGRAEIGLTGDDDFRFKVSADGSTWKDAIVIDKSSGQVSFPQGGGASDVDLMLAELALGLADALNVAQYLGDSGNRFADSFDALTYVDTAGATNLDTGTAGLLKPTQSSTSYANTGGTGARGGSITVTTDLTVASGSIGNTVNGSTANDSSNAFYYSTGQSVSGKYLRFDFGSGNAKYIDEVKIYQQTGGSFGTWKWQGSNDASTWVDVSGNLTWSTGSSPLVETLTHPSGAAAYRYYQKIGVSSTINDFFISEFDFKLTAGSPGVNNLTVKSTGLTAAAAPSSMKVVARVKETGSVTLNTDLIISVSRDGGTTFSNATMSSRFTANNLHVIESAATSVTSQPSGTSVKWKVTTANNKMIEFHDIYLYWS